ncbi:hypothetical protein HH310_41240 [Actinoplanes sp. TBRC 11911]|uniref:hypothetical protein n=1 Tax=Actinoplanes sp. TBRC 11911 TaxID=2729386 RepID=UPI00145D6B05|nr:hypothetical protein [Actinoplanes sp. TBRC 11911]NMO57579.1 hypothetical protein [Actinoplanes sp. TBRC 11911]
MTQPTFANIAEDDAHVGVQIGILHLDVDYQPPPEASPEQIFRIGVRYLDARILDEARKLIEEAVALGCVTTNEVHFCRLLALLSGRSLRHLDLDELDQLSSICHRIGHVDGDDSWAVGLRCILMLLDNVGSADPALTVKKIEELPERQRALILDHLGVLREGPLEDRMWQLSAERARSGQLAADRTGRAWIFFQPNPARARVREAGRFSVRLADLGRAALGGLVFLIAVVEVGSLVLQSGGLVPIIAYLAAVLGAVMFAWQGAEWHFRYRRVRGKDAEFVALPRDETAPPGGFARRVDRLFDDYFGRYVPGDTDRSTWLQQTAGIRQCLRDEIVEIYREQRIHGDQIAWLVRYLVSDVRQRWENGTLAAYRQQLRTPLPVIARCLLGLAAIVLSGLWIMPAAIRAAPLAGALWTILAAASAFAVTIGGFRIDTERRRVRADKDECADKLRAREEAYKRWMRKLARKPTDAEMAGWLECDRRILIDETMRHYKLKASQVIAQGFIEAPGRSAKRARIHRGPWRYSRYQLLLFLLTDDGVRQVDIELDFEKVLFRPSA